MNAILLNYIMLTAGSNSRQPYPPRGRGSRKGKRGAGDRLGGKNERRKKGKKEKGGEKEEGWVDEVTAMVIIKSNRKRKWRRGKGEVHLERRAE